MQNQEEDHMLVYSGKIYRKRKMSQILSTTWVATYCSRRKQTYMLKKKNKGNTNYSKQVNTQI